MVIENFNHSLTCRHSKLAIEEARQAIEEGMKGEQLFLYTRYPKLNKLMLGGFRFNNFVFIAGPSGGGKSMFLNMLLRDFMDPQLNGGFKHPFKILHFNFEMSGGDEMLRSVSGKVGMSYGDLLSAETPVTPDQYARIIPELESLQNDKLYYVEKAGTRMEIRETIYKFHSHFPDHKLVITLDHSLLVKYLDEQTEVDLLSELGKMFIEVRKDLGALIIVLGQTNDKLEESRRRENPSLHYPTKTDIHGSKQVYHAADVVMILNRPELLHIEFYGQKRYSTSNTLFLHCLKQRKGDVGLIRYTADFSRGAIYEYKEPSEQFNTIPEPTYGF
jgi:replicative DNA helicase